MLCICVCFFFLNFRFLIAKFNDKIGSFALHSDEVFIDDSPRVLSVISSKDCPNKLCLIDSLRSLSTIMLEVGSNEVSV
jgi:hypothetical protein